MLCEGFKRLARLGWGPKRLEPIPHGLEIEEKHPPLFFFLKITRGRINYEQAIYGKQRALLFMPTTKEICLKAI